MGIDIEKDYYKDLGVSIHATQEEITKRYKQEGMILKYDQILILVD